MSSSPGGCGSSGMAGCPPLPEPPFNSVDSPSSTYMVNSKIMVVAVAVLFAVVVFILSLHVYAKWFWRNQGALGSTDGALRTLSWRRRRRAANPNLSNNTNPLVEAQSVGLEKSVIAALPTFEFDAKTGALECAVCLEEFEQGEKGRTLPKCGHHFHVECVDMWLHSHSTCPLCRSSVHDDEPKGTEPASEHQQHPDDAPVSGDVHAPFMAAMRASRRRQRSRNATSQLPSTGVASLTSDTPTGNPPTDSEPGQANQGATAPPVLVDPKALALQYEVPAEIPSNVLFWGNQTPGAQPSVSQPVRAPFQVAIDIPGGSSASGIAMSPMARASASFRRLLSRGKSVVSPQGDGPDEGGPSSDSPPHPHQMPPPPNYAP